MIAVLIKENEKPTTPPRPKIVITRYDPPKEYLVEENKKGFGIFFAVNDFEATDEEMKKLGVKTKRNIPFLKNLNYVFADLDIAKAYDGTTWEEKERRKDVLLDAVVDFCRPTKVILTANGLQPLWKLKRCGTDGETQRRYVAIINGIIEWSKQHGGAGDDVKDVCRVLRQEGYYHMKEEPVMIKAIEETKQEYTLEELEEKFKDYLPKEKPSLKKLFETNGVKLNPVYQEVDRIDFQDLIKRAFASMGRKCEFDKTGRVILDDRETGTFQGRKGNRDYLASSSHEPFKGNRVTAVADIMGSSPKEAFAWIMKEFNLSHTNSNKKIEVQEKIKNMENPKEKPLTKYYTWGTDELTKTFAPIKRNTPVVLVGETGEGKSTFAFDVAIKNAGLGHKVLYLSLEMTARELQENIARSYSGMTIGEEVYNEIPEVKQVAFNRRMAELQNIKNLTTKGIVGTQEVDWDCVLELIKGDWDLIILDNLDLINGERGENDYDRQKRISKNILNYCNSEQVPIILLHHYNKPAGASGARSIHNVSGSAKITHNAHRVVMLKRKNEVKDKKTGVFIPRTKIEEAMLYLHLVKGRGYNKAFKLVYFNKGTFLDSYPVEQVAVDTVTADWLLPF
jgi:hypothetical protein